MGEDKPRELKLVDVSFVASLKFWLAFLIVQVIVMVVVFGIMFAFLSLVMQLIPEYPYGPTAMVSQLNVISNI